MSEKKSDVGKLSLLITVVALLLTMLLFVCIVAFSGATTKTFAAYTEQTATPTKIVTATVESSPSPTLTPRPSPTMALSPTPKPTATSVPTVVPSPTVAIKPTATSVPTVAPSPTVAIKPTVVITSTVVYPTPIVTQKAEPLLPLPSVTQISTVVSLKPTRNPVEIANKRQASMVAPEQDALYSSSHMVPLFVGTLLTLCLGAVGFIGARRVRTALLPAIDLKKQKTHTSAHSWQRVRTAPQPVPPIHAQEIIPSYSPVPESQQQSINHLPPMEASPFASLNAEHKIGLHRRLGPVRLRTMTEQIAVPETPVAAPVLPTDIEDMSFLDDPMLQDTLRQYRQKGKK